MTAANELRGELVQAAAEEKAAHGLRHAIEAEAAGAVGEETGGDHAPRAGRAVHGRRADRIVDVLALQLLERELDEHAGDAADEKRRPRIDQPRAAAAGHRAAEQAAAKARRFGPVSSAPRPG